MLTPSAQATKSPADSTAALFSDAAGATASTTAPQKEGAATGAQDAASKMEAGNYNAAGSSTDGATANQPQQATTSLLPPPTAAAPAGQAAAQPGVGDAGAEVKPSPPAPAAKKHGLPDNFKLSIPDDVLVERGVAPPPPMDARCATLMRVLRVSCAACGSLLRGLWTVVRTLIALPLALVILLVVVALCLVLLLMLIPLLPLSLLLGALLPGESEAHAQPMTLPTQHVVVLGGGSGLSRAVALECVRQGADVTVLAAESEELTQTYEMMKTTSLERQAHVKQQLRCSPLELSDGPMACFVALQNVLELVGRVDCFICHPAELYLEGKGGKPPAGETEPRVSRISKADITEAVLCCVWAVRAVMFPMQRQGVGRIMVLGPAPTNAVYADRVQYKLAMQALGRSLRAEFGEFSIPVCLAAPLGSDSPSPHAKPSATPPPAAPHGWVGRLLGLSKRPASITEYAGHVVASMLVGVPYILAPGGDGVLSSSSSFGYSALTPAVLVLQALSMPALSLLDAGLPIYWREMTTRCFHRAPAAAAPSSGSAIASGYAKLEDNPMAA